MSEPTATLQKADIVIGIPSYNEVDSIAHVVREVDLGLTCAFPEHSSVIVNADSHSEDNTQGIFLATPTNHQKICVDGGVAPRSKGTNVLAILRFARQYHARCIGLFDADVTSIEHNWVERLLSPVIFEAADLVTPLYTRNRYEGNTTNHLMYPYLFAVFGKQVRQPIAGEVALSGKLCRYLLSLTPADSTLGFGIDAFLTAHALAAGFRVEQKSLSRKLHKPSFSKILRSSRQGLDTLFRVFLEIGKQISYPSIIQSEQCSVISIGEEEQYPATEVVTRISAEVKSYLIENRVTVQSLFPQLLDSFFSYKAGGYAVEADLWCRILSQAYINLTCDNLPVIRDCVVALYICRVFSYWEEIRELSPAEIEQVLCNQALFLRNLLADY